MSQTPFKTFFYFNLCILLCCILIVVIISMSMWVWMVVCLFWFCLFAYYSELIGWQPAQGGPRLLSEDTVAGMGSSTPTIFCEDKGWKDKVDWKMDGWIKYIWTFLKSVLKCLYIWMQNAFQITHIVLKSKLLNLHF